VEQLVNDPQIKALETIKTVDDDDLGPLRMQNVMFRMQETPGSIRWTGRGQGQDNEEVYGKELGLDEQRIAELKEQGAI
jgi:crotonobetainyl-CoA:carnitine CoA-transferase CaiB-like acyl-CoA transferase